MSIFEELNELKKNVSNVLDPIMLFHMNQRARILEEEIKHIKTIKVNFELIKNQESMETEIDIATQRLIWAQQFKIMEVEQMRNQIQRYEPKFNVVNVDEILKIK